MRLGLSNGMELTLTRDHEVYVVDGETVVPRRAGHVGIGSWIALQIGQNSVKDLAKIPVPPPATTYAHGKDRSRVIVRSFPEVMDEDLAWLTGFIIGDGCLPVGTSSVNVAVTSPVESKLKDLVPKLFPGAKLAITPAQEGAWSAYTTALQPQAHHAAQRPDRAAMRAELEKAGLLARLKQARAA